LGHDQPRRFARTKINRRETNAVKGGEERKGRKREREREKERERRGRKKSMETKGILEELAS